MTETLEDLLKRARELPPEERFVLAHRILKNLESPIGAMIETAWVDEICERIRKYESGEVTAFPGSEVFAQFDAR